MRFLMISVFCFQLCEPSGLAPVPLPVGEGHGCLVFPEGGADIGVVKSGERTLFTVEVSNPCDGPIGITEASLIPSDASKNGLIGIELFSRIALGPRESTEVPMAFLPAHFGDFEATVEFQTTSRPSVLPTLTFRATTAGPLLVATPSDLDFGAVQTGCDRTLDLHIINRGSTALIADEEPFGSDYSVASRSGDGPPWRLEPAPGTADSPVLNLEVTFAPKNPELTDSRLRWTSESGDWGPPTVPFRGEGVLGADRTSDPLSVPDQDQTHVLFVADRSDAMQEALESMATQSRAVFGTLDNGGVDWRVSVLAADDGCVIGPDLWIEPGTDLEQQAAQFAQMLDADRIVSPTARLRHSGFQIVQNALSAKNLASDGCNFGLLRDTGSLAVVHLSDRAEASEIAPSDYLAFLRRFTVAPEQARVYAIGAGASTGCGAAEDAEGFAEAVLASGGRYLGVCDDDAHAHPSRIAAYERGALLMPYRVKLEDNAVESTIVVKANGAVVSPPPHVYDTETQVVRFLDFTRLRGKQIEVHYQVREDCEG